MNRVAVITGIHGNYDAEAVARDVEAAGLPCAYATKLLSAA